MFAQPHFTSTPTVILLAPGFDARLVVEITTQGRQSGQAVYLVGLIAGPLRSEVGLVLFPDRLLDTITQTDPAWVLIPGGRACAQALVRDPRIHRFSQEIWRLGGQVLAAPAIASLVQDANLRVANLSDTEEPLPWFGEFLRTFR